jgi:hypothetical protein
MKRRCLSPKDWQWKDYGGRGIRVCDEWMNDFRKFFKDIGPKPDPDYSIDRIDVDGHYEPGNVRWATAIVQANNRRNRKKEEW